MEVNDIQNLTLEIIECIGQYLEKKNAINGITFNNNYMLKIEKNELKYQ